MHVLDENRNDDFIVDPGRCLVFQWFHLDREDIRQCVRADRMRVPNHAFVQRNELGQGTHFIVFEMRHDDTADGRDIDSLFTKRRAHQ